MADGAITSAAPACAALHLLCEVVDRSIVIDAAVDDNPAMSMIGVLTETGVGDYNGRKVPEL